jgi:4-amino-4-deoxy-L-arabinose transferase-like glycosyltransferase
MLVVGLVLAGNLVWILHDHQAPPWDQALYLHLSFVWRHSWHTGGLHRAVSAIYNTDPGRAPLYPLLLTPIEAQWNGVNAALAANALMLGGTIIASAVIAARLFGRRAAIPAAIFVATCPILYGLSRTPLVDILLVLLVALSIMAAIVSSGFERRGWSIAFGVFAGLAILTKLTAPGFILAPAALSMALPNRFAHRRQLTNLALGALIAAAISIPWYAVNFGASLDYLRSTTSGSLAIGTTPQPLTWHSFLRYTVGTLNFGIGAILVLVVVVAGGVAAFEARHRFRRQNVVRVAIPVAWFGVSFLATATAHNQDIRYLAPGITGVAVLAAGAVAVLRPPIVRTVFLSVAALALAWQAATYVTPVPSGSAQLSVGPSSFRLVAPLDGRQLLYARRYGMPDYATPIVRVLSGAAHRLGANGMLTVCLLESQEVVNGNTLGYVGESHGLSLSFVDLSYLPRANERFLSSAIAACPVALFIPGRVGNGRVGFLNRFSAAARLTSTDLQSFAGPRPRLPVGQGYVVEVLERRR